MATCPTCGHPMLTERPPIIRGETEPLVAGAGIPRGWPDDEPPRPCEPRMDLLDSDVRGMPWPLFALMIGAIILITLSVLAR